MTKEEQVLKSIIEDLKSDYEWSEKKMIEQQEKPSIISEKMYLYFKGISIHSKTMIDRINDKLKSYEN